MAEQRNQTPAGDNTQWTTIIRPRTGWFDVDLEELWRYRDLIVMFVKRNFTVMYKQTILGPLWIILNPLITTVLFNVVFGGIAGLREQPRAARLNKLRNGRYPSADNRNARGHGLRQHDGKRVGFPVH